jgi:hypothetical protein
VLVVPPGLVVDRGSAMLRSGGACFCYVARVLGRLNWPVFALVLMSSVGACSGRTVTESGAGEGTSTEMSGDAGSTSAGDSRGSGDDSATSAGHTTTSETDSGEVETGAQEESTGDETGSADGGESSSEDETGTQGESGGEETGPPPPDLPAPDPGPQGTPCSQLGARICGATDGEYGAQLYECVDSMGGPTWDEIDDCALSCNACEGFGHCIDGALCEVLCWPAPPLDDSCSFSTTTDPEEIHKVGVYLGNDELTQGDDCIAGVGWIFVEAEALIELCPTACADYLGGTAISIDDSPCLVP